MKVLKILGITVVITADNIDIQTTNECQAQKVFRYLELEGFISNESSLETI